MSENKKQGIDYAALRRAQQAVQAAERGDGAPPVTTAQLRAARQAMNKDRPAKKTVVLDDVGREAAIHRAVALLRTATDYYGVTVGELEEEEARIRKLSNERLMGTIKAYEFISRHAMIMLDEDKARAEAIQYDPKAASFYDAHGVNQEDLVSSGRARPRNSPSKRG